MDTFYHVRILCKSNKNEILEFDLMNEDLVQRIIIPYNQGQNFFCGGSSINHFDIEKIQIYTTNKQSREMLPDIESRRRLGFKETPAEQTISDEQYLLNKVALDVTKNFLHLPVSHRADHLAPSILQTCTPEEYKSKTDLQQWILTQMGMTDYGNRGTGAQGAISIWQISKQIPPEILPSVSVNYDLICNVLEMKDKKWLKEIHDPILSDDDDSRRFSSNGMLQFRKEILPMAHMLIIQDQRLEQGIQRSKAESNIKSGFIEQLKEFKDKFKDKLEEQAIDYILTTARDLGIGAIPILLELMKLHRVSVQYDVV